MRIHELEYEIDNKLNMQARTVTCESWEKYLENAYGHYSDFGTGEWEESPRTIVYNFRMHDNDERKLFRHHAYIMEDWME